MYGDIFLFINYRWYWDEIYIIFEIYNTNILNPGKRDTYIEIKKRIPQSPNPDYAPLIFDLMDTKASNEPVISEKVNF